MLRNACMAASFALLLAPAGWAQDTRFEISGNAGWTFSDGVSGDPILAGDGNIYDRLDPQDAFSFGFTLGYFVTPSVSLEFRWDRQSTKLEAGGTTTTEIADFDVDNYHGGVAYHFGEEDAQVRPFLFIGLGATSYGNVEFSALGQPRTIDGDTRFSGSASLGLKLYPGRSAGLRLEARWTPTYIKSDAEGWWCDPFYGCYVVGDAQYANQFEFTGGITLRF